MPSSIVTLVLYVIALSLVAVNFYFHWQASARKANACVSLVSLKALLRALRREAATPQRQNDVEFTALLVRFEAAQVEAQAALKSGSYNAVNEIVDSVGRELAVFRQSQVQEHVSQNK